MKRLACLLTMTAMAALTAAHPAHSAANTVLAPCDWHGYSLSREASGYLTAASTRAYPLECRFYQYKPAGRTNIGGRTGYGSPAIIAQGVSFDGSYTTEVCTYENGWFVECRLIW